MEQKDGDDQDLVGTKPKSDSSLPNCTTNDLNQQGYDKGSKILGGSDSDQRKKKYSSGGGKGRKGPKSKQRSKNSSTPLGKSEHSALNRTNRRSGGKRASRRRSMDWSSEENNLDQSPTWNPDTQSFSFKNKDSEINKTLEVNAVNESTVVNNDISKDNASSPSLDSKGRKHSDHSTSNPGDWSRCGSTDNNSVQSQNTRTQASTRSFCSDSQSLNLSSHHSFQSGRMNGDNDESKKSFDADDFADDIEDDSQVDCSVVELPLSIENGEKDTPSELSAPNDKDRTRSSPRESKKKKNRDPDAKQRKNKTPQLHVTDELGRGSSHYKLEGVYFNQKSEPKSQTVSDSKPQEKHSEEEEIPTKLPTESNEKDPTNKTSIKGRYRSRRRGSISNDEPTAPRSRSREQARTRREVARIRNARSLDRLRGSPKSDGSPEPQESAKKHTGSSDEFSKEDSIVAKSTSQKSLTRTENNESDNQHSSMQGTEEGSTNKEKEKVSKKINSASKDSEKKDRRRNSNEKAARKDRTSSKTSARNDPKSVRRLTREKKNRMKDMPSEEKNQEGLLASNVNRQIDSNGKNDPGSKVITSNLDSTNNSSSMEEIITEVLKENRIPSNETANSMSLSDLLTNGEHQARKEADSQFKETGSLPPPSLASFDFDFTEEKHEMKDEDDYVQLTFVANEGSKTNNIFALNENFDTNAFNGSFDVKMATELKLQPNIFPKVETDDRNSSLRSFADDFDPEVPANSFPLSKKSRDADPNGDNAVANGFGEEATKKTKMSTAPFSLSMSLHGVGPRSENAFTHDFKADTKKKKKKGSAINLGLSRSMHASPYDNDALTNDVWGEESSKKKKRDGVLKKMRMGLSEGSRLTASSSRNLLGQAKTKVLGRRREECRGLLRNCSD